MSKRKNQLVALFNSLKDDDIQNCRKLIVSPIYLSERKSEQLLPFYRILSQAQKKGNPILEDETLFNELSKELKISDKEFSYLKSDLILLIEEFLVLKEFRQDPFQKSIYLLKSFRKNNIEIGFESTYNDILKKSDKQSLRNEEYFFALSKINDEFYRNHILTNRTVPDQVELANHQFKLYSLAQNLRTLCRITSNAEVVKVEQNENYVDQDKHTLYLAQNIKDNDDDAPAIILLYLACYKMLQTQTTAAYHYFENLIIIHQDVLSGVELCDLLMLLTNFCSKKVNKGERDFLQNSFEWFVFGLDKKVFEEEGIFSTFLFKQIVTTAVGLCKYDWAEQFIERYSCKLNTNQQDNFKCYTLAIVYFNQGKNDTVFYEKAIVLLAKVDLDDIFHLSDVRRMLMRCYYELQEWNALESLIESFKKYLSRHKHEPTYQYENYKNFIYFVEKLMSIPKNDTQKRIVVQQKLAKTTQVAERIWLESKLF